jgi:hypothetical protein
MLIQPAATARPTVRQPAPSISPDHHGVRVPAGANGSIFGGWGVRF